jgi:hypothetical protein
MELLGFERGASTIEETTGSGVIRVGDCRNTGSTPNNSTSV